MAKVETGHYRLFWEKMSGAMVVELLLDEMQVPYQRVAVDMAAGAHRSPDYLALNPTGQVPALAFPSGEIIGETAAIIIALGEHHPQPSLVPAPDHPDRARFLRWLIYMAASPYMTFIQFNHPERFLDDPRSHPALVDNARRRLLDQFTLMDQAIMGAPFLLASGVSALDLYAYMLIEFFGDDPVSLAVRPRLAGLYASVAKRASVARVRPRHG
ncbi:glutathione S-transferase family protein [Paracoccus sp. M683]|uniref:glutathione S-transferase family protein n=1 Tax=Paracoccus sp. M683 TaxID=2594268 RepID=UPI00163DDAA1|nr:glutathione S-transferase family protein [Paracoccus sp. M683]